ncbi:glycosyltransferase [Gordonia jacobaea]|uniref:glycosyltransferase n=1 Tax=Gordonia jacobaea TaxID=122202 RepID=UPI0009F86B67|nr:glycosyltransferase [Gordonia jacobaea]
MKPILSILIINWNGASDTESLISDLEPQLLKFPLGEIEVLLLDNGSDLPVPTSWRLWRHVSLLETAENLGYSGGMRLLTDNAQGEYCWLVNNDVRLTDDAVSGVMKGIGASGADVLFPMVLNPDGSVQSRDCWWSGLRGWRMPRPRADEVDRYPIFGDLFVAPVIRSSLFEELGILPPLFHTYGEDIDACYALAARGLKVLRDPHIVLKHRKSSSKPVDDRQRFKFETRGAANLIASIILNYQVSSFVLAIPVAAKVLLYDMLLKRRRSFRHAWAWRFWFNIPVRASIVAWQLRDVRKLRQTHRALSDVATWGRRCEE